MKDKIVRILAFVVLFPIVFISVFIPIYALISMTDPLNVAAILYKPQPTFMEEACKEYPCVSSLSEYGACLDYAREHNLSTQPCENLAKAMFLDYGQTSCFFELNISIYLNWLKAGGWVYLVLLSLSISIWLLPTIWSDGK